MPSRASRPDPAGRREPKYLTIAADLESRIRSGEYPSGTPLPAQRALSAAYGVTLMTLRQALDVLAARGLVAPQPGRVTLVASSQANYRLDTLRSFAEDLREQGHEVSTRVRGVALRDPPAWAAAWLGTGRALRLERLRHVDGRAAIHQVSWVPMPYAEPLRARDFGRESLYSALAGVGVAVDRAAERIRPGLLGARTAALLGRAAGSPVWESVRVTQGLDGAVVVVDRATVAGELVELYTERSARRVSLRWAPAGRPPQSHSLVAMRTASPARTVPIR